MQQTIYVASCTFKESSCFLQDKESDRDSKLSISLFLSVAKMYTGSL